MKIASPIAPREKILTFGAGGVGKSEALLSIAKKIGDNKVYVVCTDDRWDFMLAYDDPGNVEVLNIDHSEWDEYIPAIVEMQGRMQSRDDWLGFDLSNPSYDALVAKHVVETYDQELDEFYGDAARQKAEFEAAGGKKKGVLNVLEGFTDWSVINKKYPKLIKQLVQTNGHLYMTAEVGPVGEQERDADMKALYGNLGVRAKGNKRLVASIPNTIMYMTKSATDEFKITSVKDTKRERVRDKVVQDFARDYLMAIAGWRPVKAETEA